MSHTRTCTHTNTVTHIDTKTPSEIERPGGQNIYFGHTDIYMVAHTHIYLHAVDTLAIDTHT